MTCTSSRVATSWVIPAACHVCSPTTTPALSRTLSAGATPIDSTWPRYSAGPSSDPWTANLMLDEPALRTTTNSDMAVSGDNIGAAVNVDRSASDAVCEGRGEVGAGETDVHDVHKFTDGCLRRCLVQ